MNAPIFFLILFPLDRMFHALFSHLANPVDQTGLAVLKVHAVSAVSCPCPPSIALQWWFRRKLIWTGCEVLCFLLPLPNKLGSKTRPWGFRQSSATWHIFHLFRSRLSRLVERCFNISMPAVCWLYAILQADYKCPLSALTFLYSVGRITLNLINVFCTSLHRNFSAPYLYLIWDLERTDLSNVIWPNSSYPPS